MFLIGISCFICLAKPMALTCQEHSPVTARTQKWQAPGHCQWPPIVIEQLDPRGRPCTWQAGVHSHTQETAVGWPEGWTDRASNSALAYCLCNLLEVATLISGMLESPLWQCKMETIIHFLEGGCRLVHGRSTVIWYSSPQTECESWSTYLTYSFGVKSKEQGYWVTSSLSERLSCPAWSIHLVRAQYLAQGGCADSVADLSYLRIFQASRHMAANGRSNATHPESRNLCFAFNISLIFTFNDSVLFSNSLVWLCNSQMAYEVLSEITWKVYRGIKLRLSKVLKNQTKDMWLKVFAQLTNSLEIAYW